MTGQSARRRADGRLVARVGRQGRRRDDDVEAGRRDGDACDRVVPVGVGEMDVANMLHTDSFQQLVGFAV